MNVRPVDVVGIVLLLLVLAQGAGWIHLGG
jgi:hypothetical protein